MKTKSLQKSEQIQAKTNNNSSQKFQSRASAMHSRFESLQRTIGNRAVGCFIQSRLQENAANASGETTQLLQREMIQREGSKEEEEEKLRPTIQLQPEEEEEKPQNIQAKLTLGTPGDVYEQEADTVAHKISNESGISDFSNLSAVQEKILSSIDPHALGGMTGNALPAVSTNVTNRKIVAINKKQGPAEQGAVAENIESRILQSKGSGSPLPSHINTYMSMQTGYDFSNVRVKSNSESASLNNALGARAFTNGSDIWLGSGEKATDVKLMAHELTHVVQQGAAGRIQSQPNSFCQMLSSKGYMPKFTEALTKSPHGNSSIFQKDIVQFIHNHPLGKMGALQAKVLDGVKNGSINQRENAQTLRATLAGCSSSSNSGTSAGSMSIEVLIPPRTTGDCGGVLSQVRWKVPDSSPDGTIVQHMHVKYDKLEKCNGDRINSNFHPYDPLEFYEAWEVKGGKIYVGWANGSNPEHRSDTFSGCIDYGSGSRGNGKATGKVAFLGGYNNSTESGWGPHRFAGSLPTRSTPPKGWSTATKLDHWLSTEWNCCPSDDSSKWQKTKVDGQPKS